MTTVWAALAVLALNQMNGQGALDVITSPSETPRPRQQPGRVAPATQEGGGYRSPEKLPARLQDIERLRSKPRPSKQLILDDRAFYDARAGRPNDRITRDAG